MLLVGEENINEPSHSYFEAFELLGSSGRIKLSIYVSGTGGQNPKHLIQNRLSLCFGWLLLPVVLISAHKLIIFLLGSQHLVAFKNVLDKCVIA